MISAIVCTHGNAAKELVKSAEMICGEQTNCETVEFTMGESLDDLKNDLKKKIDTLNESVICLTDLKGGTPFNTLVSLSRNYSGMKVVTGVNIPMLLQLFVYREQLEQDKLIESIINAGQKGIFEYEVEDVEEEDF